MNSTEGMSLGQHRAMNAGMNAAKSAKRLSRMEGMLGDLRDQNARLDRLVNRLGTFTDRHLGTYNSPPIESKPDSLSPGGTASEYAAAIDDYRTIVTTLDSILDRLEEL